MSQTKKLFMKVCSGSGDKNIKFAELRHLLSALGFVCIRINGDHFIYIKTGIDEIINIQPQKNGMAKPYQVKQLRELMEKYGLEVLTWKNTK